MDALRLNRRPIGKQAVVCVDFDGVLHEYYRWNGNRATGSLIPGAIAAIDTLKRFGFRVEIFSTRKRRFIKRWLQSEAPALLPLIDRIRSGKPYYFAFFDDRAHNVPSNEPYALQQKVLEWLESLQQ